MSVRPIRAALAAFAALVAAAFVASAQAQTSPSDFTSATRYDAEHRVTGTIAPDPDGSGLIHYAAVRNSYDAAGRLIRVEKGELSSWLSENTAPAIWTGFTLFSQIDTVYDVMDRKVTETVSSGGVAYALTQYSYDAAGRLECTAVRMNPAVYASLPSSACTLGTPGAQGDDRITRTVYDAADQVLKVQKAYGSPLQQDYQSYGYTLNGKPAFVIDANGNKSGYGYDGFDRLVLWAFPSTTVPAAASTTDYEAYGYDANGNRTSMRKRDGRTINYAYDALNRPVSKTFVSGGACVSGYACTTPPSGAVRNVYYSYDLRGLQTYARFDSASGTDATTNVYDGFGRLTSSGVSMGGVSRSVGQSYDADGNRIRVTHPDGTYFTYDYDGLDRPIAIRQNGGTQVASYSYDARTQRAASARGAVLTTYGYDPVSRLASLADDLSGTSADVAATFGYNPASQLIGQTRSNDAYAFAGYTVASNAYTANGLNQYTAVGAGSLGYDSNGNLASTSGTSFAYDVENRLVAAAGTLATAMVYDPMGRLYQTTGTSGVRQFLYDGDQRVGEYDGGSGGLLRRYVHGDGDDDPLLWYEGSGLADMRSLQSDHQGSIVSVADASGALIGINSYDEYGVPGSGNIGAFQYTGQAWLPDLGMYYYKARIYSAKLGRFLQTDPIGYKDQMDLYAYVGNDPIDGRDPSGLEANSCSRAGGSSCSGSYGGDGLHAIPHVDPCAACHVGSAIARSIINSIKGSSKGAPPPPKTKTSGTAAAGAPPPEEPEQARRAALARAKGAMKDAGFTTNDQVGQIVRWGKGANAIEVTNMRTAAIDRDAVSLMRIEDPRLSRDVVETFRDFYQATADGGVRAGGVDGIAAARARLMDAILKNW